MIMFRAKAFMMPCAKSAMSAVCANTQDKKVATEYSHKSPPPMSLRSFGARIVNIYLASGMRRFALLVQHLDQSMKIVTVGLEKGEPRMGKADYKKVYSLKMAWIKSDLAIYPLLSAHSTRKRWMKKMLTRYERRRKNDLRGEQE